MSPNPLQRKLLYKKKEVQFSLGDLKNLAKRRAKVARYKHILGWRTFGLHDIVIVKPPHPNISMHILLTDLKTFSKVLIRRIC